LLIRDAAYDSLPKEIRSELHERFATWLETRRGLVEIEEIVGYHLEQAHRNLADLNPEDPRLDALRARAGARLFTAAKGASGRGDWGAAPGSSSVRSTSCLQETSTCWRHWSASRGC